MLEKLITRWFICAVVLNFLPYFLISFNLPKLPVLFYADFTKAGNIKIINANMGNFIFLHLTTKSSIVKLGQKGNMAAFYQKDLAKKEGMENEGFIYDRRSRGSL